MKINKKNIIKEKFFLKGFSLIEILVYAAIFTMISILVINSFITVSATFSIIRTNRDLMHSGLSVTERISREIHRASTIDLINSRLESGVLHLNGKDDLSNPITISFVYESGILNFYRDGVIIGNLLSGGVVLDSLIFRRIDTTKGEALKVEMILTDTKSKKNKTANFYSTFILKGSY